MKMISQIAFGAALAFGGFAVASVPATSAYAQDAEPYEAKLTKKVRQSLGAAQEAEAAGDTAGMVAAAREAMPNAKTGDDRYLIGANLYKAGQKLNDTAMEREGLTMMARSGSGYLTPTLIEQTFAGAAQMADQAGDAAEAEALYGELLAINPNSNAAIAGRAEMRIRNGDVAGGIASLKSAIEAQEAAGTKAEEAWYRRAFVLAFQNDLAAEVTPLGMMLVDAYPNETNWRDALVTTYATSDYTDEELIDLFRLMREVNALERRFYLEYGNYMFEKGFPGEADDVLSAGIASGALDPNTGSVKELKTLASGRVSADRAELPGLAKEAASETNGKLAASTANALLGYGDNAEAARLFRLALDKGGVDADQVNTRLGIALMRSGDKAGAKSAFEAVTGKRDTIADYWLAYMEKGARPAPVEAAPAAATPAEDAPVEG
ncbi:MAG: hypothetical protein WA979_13705 [Pacificimonas sp.]